MRKPPSLTYPRERTWNKRRWVKFYFIRFGLWNSTYRKVFQSQDVIPDLPQGAVKDEKGWYLGIYVNV